MPRRRHRRATRLATQAIELGIATPEVIAHRVMRMALAGSSPSTVDRQEFLRMTAEKVAAFHESWINMSLAAWRANLQFFLSGPAWSAVWLRGGPRLRNTKMQHAALEIVSSGLAPIHRRAVRNAKRLRK
jgi:predicted RNA-binding Zn ribbon-like protein